MEKLRKSEMLHMTMKNSEINTMNRRHAHYVLMISQKQLMSLDRIQERTVLVRHLLIASRLLGVNIWIWDNLYNKNRPVWDNPYLPASGLKISVWRHQLPAYSDWANSLLTSPCNTSRGKVVNLTYLASTLHIKWYGYSPFSTPIRQNKNMQFNRSKAIEDSIKQGTYQPIKKKKILTSWLSVKMCL